MNALPDSLPRGPYPTAVWPHGIAAIKQAQAVNAAVLELQRKAAATAAQHVFTLRPYVQPKPDAIVSVELEGAKHAVALYKDDAGTVWVEAILLGGKWHGAEETFGSDFVKALERQVREDRAYESDTAAGMPDGVVMP